MRPVTASRLARLAPRVLVVALVLGGCTSTEAIGWRYDSTTTAAPSVAPSAAPSAAPPASPCATATTGATTIHIAATNVAFDQSALNAPACASFQIVFQNNDAGTQHNVQIKAAGNSVFRGDLLTGIGSATYTVPALQAGAYTFNCSVHPSMNGTLTVQ